MQILNRLMNHHNAPIVKLSNCTLLAWQHCETREGKSEEIIFHQIRLEIFLVCLLISLAMVGRLNNDIVYFSELCSSQRKTMRKFGRFLNDARIELPLAATDRN